MPTVCLIVSFSGVELFIYGSFALSLVVLTHDGFGLTSGWPAGALSVWPVLKKADEMVKSKVHGAAQTNC